MRFAFAAALLFALTGCGRVAAPQPPFVRIPDRVHDLAASQNAMAIVLAWTNPEHNIDGSTATGLSSVHIISGSEEIAKVAPTGPGQRQSLSIPVQSGLGVERTFEVRVQTDRGKVSEQAKVSITPVEVPGAVAGLLAIVDQYSIQVRWTPPASNPSLAESYVVSRRDRTQPPAITSESQYLDSAFVRGSQYTYDVVAARRVAGGLVPGLAAPPVTVTAVDTTPPKGPAGVQVVVTETGAFVTWNANVELDLAGYRVFRNGVAMSATLVTGTSIFDPDYRPGTTYSVSAVDEFGNASDKITG